MMNALTNAETIKECRAAARANGLTFKRDGYLIVNGSQAYKYINRKTGAVVLSALTLGLAYEIACSGELAA